MLNVEHLRGRCLQSARWRSLFYSIAAGRWRLFRLLIMLRLNAYIEQRVVQQCLHLLELVINRHPTNRLAFISIPTRHFFLHMVEQRVQTTQGASQTCSVPLMFLAMGILGRIKNLVSLGVDWSETGVVPIVVMEFQTQLIRHCRESPREVIHMGEATELQGRRLHWSRGTHRHLNARAIDDWRCLIVIVRIVIGVVRSVIVLLWRNDVVIVFVMRCHMLAMRVDDHMTLVPRGAVGMAVMMVLGEDRCSEPRASCQREDHVADKHFISLGVN